MHFKGLGSVINRNSQLVHRIQPTSYYFRRLCHLGSVGRLLPSKQAAPVWQPAPRCNYIPKRPTSVKRSADMTWGTCLNFDALTPCLCFKRHCPSTAQGVESNVVVVFQSQEMRKKKMTCFCIWSGARIWDKVGIGTTNCVCDSWWIKDVVL